MLSELIVIFGFENKRFCRNIFSWLGLYPVICRSLEAEFVASFQFRLVRLERSAISPLTEFKLAKALQILAGRRMMEELLPY